MTLPTLIPRDVVSHRLDTSLNTPEELRFVSTKAAQSFREGSSGDDAWLSAWLASAYANSLSIEETACLTEEMANSGLRMDLSSLGDLVVDKHSTGGVGDKTTIVILPILAACGLTSIKMSGKGLGHTGGTIDKLHSVPGFRTNLTPEEMIAAGIKCKIALAGQSSALAPADGKLYELRDLTGTVSSIPLVVASILSKKLAGGAKIVGLDVKAGRGAIMQDPDEARKLAEMLVAVGTRLGLNVHAMVTDMDAPLGYMVGNALEVKEAAGVLRNEKTGPLRDLCVALAVQTLHSVGLPDAEAKIQSVIESGAALDFARSWFQNQGGDPTALDHDQWCMAAHRTPVVAKGSGFVAEIDAREVGEVAVRLGAGRTQKGDEIDPSVGIELLKARGDQVSVGEEIFVVHHSQTLGEDLMARLTSSLVISQTPVQVPPQILSSIG